MHFFVPVVASAMVTTNQIGNCCAVEESSGRVVMSLRIHELFRAFSWAILGVLETLRRY